MKIYLNFILFAIPYVLKHTYLCISKKITKQNLQKDAFLQNMFISQVGS